VWIALSCLLLGGAGAFVFYQDRYGRMLEEDLRQGAFNDAATIFMDSEALVVGAPGSVAESAAYLRRAGYTDSRENPIGWFEQRAGAVVIYPASAGKSTEITFAGSKIARILTLPDNSALTRFQLEPQILTSVTLRDRERRRLLRYCEIPQCLIDAVVSVEDKRFFNHQGFDVLRILKSASVNLRQGRPAEGASTITMQLVRSLWLARDKNWKRKEAQFFMALRLERRLSKGDIFEHYANEVYLGQRGTYAIHGFGEAARAYFDKPVGALTISEAATLAGVIQRPSYYNPFRFPQRVRERRDRVLEFMRLNGHITERDYKRATDEPLILSPGARESVEAPYYVDLIRAELRKQLVDATPARGGYQVYSTLDPRLQRAAEVAVRNGMVNVDKLLPNIDTNDQKPQVALVALDPRTGSIKALVGGRDYNASQLNHALANRQPGSVFKPFVYAAALRTAARRGVGSFTAATLLDDVPTTFWFEQQPYAPSNFKQTFRGEVTLRQALSRSVNVATVQLAQRVGYRAVVALARSAGFSQEIQPTPAVALGAYESTPLEVAGAYTVFANQGLYVQPHMVSHVLGDGGVLIYAHEPVTNQALTPQVAYLMVNLLEDVLRSGTGAGVRARGFTAPAAGKTGTSRDGWFAGFTSDLVCVVWVGFDDHRDLKLEGSKSALPIWTEFMKQAVLLMGAPKPFRPPSGIVSVEVDPLSGLLATPQCPTVRPELFITGTQPVEFCGRHGHPIDETTVTATLASAK
jgi:penicillin-binding protein 1B